MYLKSIRVNGFKSFADKLELSINKGITGIVGPNGSGKSNVLDAVRWVLGEQSVKALRGDNSMTDIIFAGSKSRNAQNRASVSLTFDNSDHYLNSDFSEIEVKRIVYKSGENEYYINNSKVRLKDITNLFLDSGAGKESFNIISQGAVADIVNSKPEDRRVIFEEAAGVLKYKKRKEETLRKLEKTNENLARVNMLIDEISVTIEPLKEQSEKAKKYLEYKKELESIEISLIVNDIKEINSEYEQVKENVLRLNKELEELDTSNSKDTSKIEELKLQSLKLDNEIEEKNTLIINITKELANLESKKQITIERQKYEVDDAKLQSSIILLKEELLNLNNSIISLDNEIKLLKTELETKQLKSMELIKTNEEKREEKNKINSSMSLLNKDIMNINNKIDILTENINNDTKIPYSVKSVINNIRLKGIHGILGKLIETKEEYSTAIEIALASASNTIVVDDEKSSKEAINYLKENKLGRATFFPLSVIKERSIPIDDLNKVKEKDGFIGIASDLTKYEEKYKNVVLNQLGNVIVVDNIDTLNNFGKLLNYKYKIVSKDGEILYAGGAITGGNNKNSGGILNQKYELENLKKQLTLKKEDLNREEHKFNKINQELEHNAEELEKNQRNVIILTETLNQKNSVLNDLNKQANTKNNELEGTKNVSNNSLEKELDDILNEYYKKSSVKETEEKALAKLKNQKSDIQTEISSFEKVYRDLNYKITQKQNELKQEEIKQGKLDVKLDNLLLTLNETYSMTYEKASEMYELDIFEGTARLTVNNLKSKIRELGEVNTGSIAEYERLNERHTFLSTQKEDLDKSVTSLMNVITEMDDLMKNKFIETFEKISEEFKNVFKKLFKGGEGILELTNPDDLLSTGIEISALPPGKKLNSIALLSGGEKTLTAIALLFAILNVKPVPFVILDEVEAALDEANVDAFGNYLLSRKERSQFIVITHKKRTMEYADVLYGITMQESGVSKLVSVKLEG